MSIFTQRHINKMRTCRHALPDPGGRVVRECLDEIERLRGALTCRVVDARRYNEVLGFFGQHTNLAAYEMLQASKVDDDHSHGYDEETLLAAHNEIEGGEEPNGADIPKKGEG